MKAELLAVFGDDLMVVNTARVSMGKWHDEFDPETDPKLIKYLAANQHWSPFSHPKAQFRLTLPIFVARQWEKHRVGCVRGYDVYDQNEISRRYVDDTPQFWEPDTWRRRPEGSIKQGSGEDLGKNPSYWATSRYTSAVEYAIEVYHNLLAMGIAPEQARTILPQSMYTSWIETGSLAYWARVCSLRLDPHAQLEIRELARQVYEQMLEKFPVSWEALMEAVDGR
jgi:thymidylate synthase (FAD)